MAFPEGKPFTESEEDTLFKIISSDSESGKLACLVDLIRSLEHDLFKEMASVDRRDDELVVKQTGVEEPDNIG